MKKKLSKPLIEPPLRIRTFTEVDPVTGAKVKVTRTQRGILGTEHRTFDSNSFLAWAENLSSWCPKKHFEGLREALRNQLEGWGIPSDRQYAWIKRPGEDWRPRIEGEEIEIPSAFAIWYSRMKDLTEPLSQKRQVGEALWELDQLLRRKGIDEHLWHIAQVVSALGTLRISGATNVMASSGMAASKGRSFGPAAKRVQAGKRRAVIRDFAARLRAVSPQYKGDASNTAAVIANDVNKELLARNLLPAGRGMSAKTIADHLRRSVRGKTFRAG